MMRARLDLGSWLALLASAGLALCACIDTPLSLGHHSSAAPPPDDGDAAKVMDAAMEPQGGSGGQGGGGGQGGSGGQGGQGGVAGLHLPDAATPMAMPCDEGTFSVLLECQVEDGFFGSPGGPPMSASTTLAASPRLDRLGVASVSGPLDFSAWGLAFSGRIEGELDCARGVFRAAIFDGEVTMPGTPPGPFFGQLDGLLDPFDGTISGPWWHGPEMQGGPRCTGPWAATRD